MNIKELKHWLRRNRLNGEKQFGRGRSKSWSKNEKSNKSHRHIAKRKLRLGKHEDF